MFRFLSRLVARWIGGNRGGTAPEQQPATIVPTVEMLMEGLLERCPATRLAVAQTLGRLGPVAAAAIPALRQARFDPHPSVREAIFTALCRIDPNWQL